MTMTSSPAPKALFTIGPSPTETPRQARRRRRLSMFILVGVLSMIIVGPSLSLAQRIPLVDEAVSEAIWCGGADEVRHVSPPRRQLSGGRQEVARTALHCTTGGQTEVIPWTQIRATRWAITVGGTLSAAIVLGGLAALFTGRRFGPERLVHELNR